MTLKPANGKDNSKHRFSGGGPRPDNNEIKRAEADERNAAWAKLSPSQQLEALDRRLGKGVGAAKQRARLLERIEKARGWPSTEALTAAKPAEKTKAKDRRALERGDRPAK